MSNSTFAGPSPDDNLTLNQVNDVVARLKNLGMAAILQVMKSALNSYAAVIDIYSEQDLLDFGVDPTSDPVWSLLLVTNEGTVVTNPNPNPWGNHMQTAAAVKRRLDRGGQADLNTLIWSVFGINSDVKTISAQIIAQLPAGKTLLEVMQGR